MAKSAALEKAFANLDALTTRAFRKRTMGLKDPEEEAENEPIDHPELGSEKAEGVDIAGDQSEGDGPSDKALDEETLRRILESLKIDK